MGGSISRESSSDEVSLVVDQMGDDFGVYAALIRNENIDGCKLVVLIQENDHDDFVGLLDKFRVESMIHRLKLKTQLNKLKNELVSDVIPDIRIQTQVVSVLMFEQLVAGFGVTKRSMFSIGMRNGPTTMTLMISDVMAAKIPVEVGLQKMLTLFHSFTNQSMPTKQAIAQSGSCRATLVCECCFSPQNVEPFPLVLNAESLPFIVPFAIATLLGARALNLDANTCKLLFGPDLRITDQSITEANSFLDKVAALPLDHVGASLPAAPSTTFKAPVATVASADRGGDLDELETTLRGLEALLEEADPAGSHAGLVCVHDPKGFKYYVCASCVDSYGLAYSTSSSRYIKCIITCCSPHSSHKIVLCAHEGHRWAHWTRAPLAVGEGREKCRRWRAWSPMATATAATC